MNWFFSEFRSPTQPRSGRKSLARGVSRGIAADAKGIAPAGAKEVLPAPLAPLWGFGLRTIFITHGSRRGLSACAPHGAHGPHAADSRVRAPRSSEMNR